VLIGSAAGLAAGLLLALAAMAALRATGLPGRLGPGEGFPYVALAALFVFLGLLVGAHRGARFSWASLKAGFRADEGKRLLKVLDTSVIIDGRISDIAETGFLDGTMVIPQFVLRELQTVADSSDPLKRARGRKGLDVLQELRKSSRVEVQFSEMDFPEVREVDQKLIEVAKYLNAPIVTNDFNLNKVAKLRGVTVLNVNELANALKPVVLPGETLKVFLIKEGKERDQAVAYLDDGTMVVVDSARHLIGTKVEVVVTSVLQTTAGKMIFGVWEEDPARRKQIVRRRHAE
jgi:uncharacterized protein YacL